MSLNLVLGENGIIAKAKEAKSETERDILETQTAINSLYDELAGYLDGESSGGNGGTGGTGSLPSTDYTTPYLPSSSFTQVAGTDLSSGLVIQDSTGNQYVWVEVPRTTTVYPTAGTTLDLDTLTGTELETAYTNIEKDLHTYTSKYITEIGYSDTYHEDSATGWFKDETAYNNAKKDMLKSVYQNGGFYVGRYETGIADSPRIESGETTQTPVIKANAYPYNLVTRTQAQVLANSMYSGNRTSSLMFGVQWDLVLKYLETKAVEKGAELATIQEELKGITTGSKSWGNYENAEIPITNINAKCAILEFDVESYISSYDWKSVPASYKKPSSGEERYVLLSTGANEERNSKQNICDLAGNVFEWTLEKGTEDSYSCVFRGGSYMNESFVYPASSRGTEQKNVVSDDTGFRVSLY